MFVYRYTMMAVDHFNGMNHLNRLRVEEIADDGSSGITNDCSRRATKMMMSVRHGVSTPFFDGVVYETIDAFVCLFVTGVH